MATIERRTFRFITITDYWYKDSDTIRHVQSKEKQAKDSHATSFIKQKVGDSLRGESSIDSILFDIK